MIKLYHAPQSRSSRIIWLLEELGVPYHITPVSIFRPMTGEGHPDPANPHPDQRVPAIEHGDTLITESVGIALYLGDAVPAAEMAPVVGCAGRGAYCTWLGWYACEMEPAMFAGLSGGLAASPAKQRDHAAMMRRLESTLTHNDYVMGDQFTVADVLIASALNFARKAFPDSAPIEAYVERCKRRPAAIRAVARDGASGLQHAAQGVVVST
jgi:glutathione S-transferase